MIQVTDKIDKGYIHMEIGEHVDENNTQKYLDRFTQMIERQEHVGVVFHYTGGRPKKTKAASSLEDAWLRAHRSEIGRYCSGIAMIATPGIASLLQKIVLKGVGQRVFGCDCEMFYSLADAEAWFEKRSSKSTSRRSQA